MELAWIIRGLRWFCLESMIRHAFISALPWIQWGLIVDFSHLDSCFIICICFLAEVKGIFCVGVVMELAFLVGSWAPLMNRSLQKFWLQWFVLCFTSFSSFSERQYTFIHVHECWDLMLNSWMPLLDLFRIETLLCFCSQWTLNVCSFLSGSCIQIFLVLF